MFDPTPEIDWRSECEQVFNLTQAKEYIADHFDSEFRVCIIPEFGQEEKELDQLCLFLIELQRLYHLHKAKITLVVDELDMSFNTGTSLKNKKSYFAYLCRRGRHLGVNLLGISQRINQVDTAFRSNLSGVYLFQHTEQIDIRQVLQMLHKSYHETFLNLAPRQYIYTNREVYRKYSQITNFFIFLYSIWESLGKPPVSQLAVFLFLCYIFLCNSHNITNKGVFNMKSFVKMALATVAGLAVFTWYQNRK